MTVDDLMPMAASPPSPAEADSSTPLGNDDEDPTTEFGELATSLRPDIQAVAEGETRDLS
jgi:hypothetical protein